MFGYEKIELNFSFDSIYFFIGLILLIAYSIYVYRFTLPKVTFLKRAVLTVLRSSALLLLLFIFFEPVLILAKKNILTPIDLFFFDNSKSIRIKDGTERVSTLKDLIKQTKSNSSIGNKRYFSFGSDIKEINADSLSNLDFSEASTDLAKIFENLEQTESNISAIIIVSDGVITEGSTPIYTAEKNGIPVLTVGIGDSSRKNDIGIKNVISNDFIYAETPTTVLATILNKGFESKTTQISLFENMQLIKQKNLQLSESGVNSIEFEYTPKESGEKKLSLKINNQSGESNFSNNQKVFYINVLSNKINVLLLAGSPSADLTFIKNTLSSDKNLKVNTLTQIKDGNFLENNPGSKIDSSNIIYLIDYPTINSNTEIFDKLVDKLTIKSVPFFFLLSSDVDVSKLNKLSNLLPISIQKIDKNYIQVQPDIQIGESNNPLIQNNSINEWNNLPPIYQSLTTLTVKPDSKLLSKIKINSRPASNPLIVTRNIGLKRSISIIGKDIWKWKLQSATKNSTLFDNFIINTTRWLNAPDDQKKVKISTSKKIYSAGEKVDFSAQVYDESFNPVNDALLKLNINGKDSKDELILNSLGGGLYDGSIFLSKNGDYTYDGMATQNGKSLGVDKGSFNIGDVEIEFIDTRMNYEFLNLLTNQTRGKYFDPKNYYELLETLKVINSNASKEKITTSEIRLWSDEWLLVMVIIIFGTEWFLRKRSGML